MTITISDPRLSACLAVDRENDTVRKVAVFLWSAGFRLGDDEVREILNQLVGRDVLVRCNGRYYVSF